MIRIRFLDGFFCDTLYLGRSDDSSEAEDVSVLQRRIRMYKGQVSTMKLEVERLKVKTETNKSVLDYKNTNALTNSKGYFVPITDTNIQI